MKECFFCLEQMLDQEYVCKHCKNWQPSKTEIDGQRWRVSEDLVSSHVGVVGFYKAVFRGIFLVALAITLKLVFDVGLNSSLMIERLSEWRSQFFAASAIVFAWVFVIVLSLQWELMRARIKVSENKYLIERILRYQLQSAPMPRFDLHKLDMHTMIVGLIVLAVIIFFK